MPYNACRPFGRLPTLGLLCRPDIEEAARQAAAGEAPASALAPF